MVCVNSHGHNIEHNVMYSHLRMKRAVYEMNTRRAVLGNRSFTELRPSSADKILSLNLVVSPTETSKNVKMKPHFWARVMGPVHSADTGIQAHSVREACYTA